ncbi:NnrU family protein [Celeribacter neptunius]|uniref:Uncharacterized membrane protein n=1 Tax=Celeribacter neptunius TaxID=588602 RepID=A0A1I3R6E2_9RHOB|nr:NnrU family protein [Celeribacter neptunius]SFJ41620.1 Uncharacterized membrane protein [Celeribacter neptunius]
MTGWGSFILAFVVFFLSHAIPVRPPVKPWVVARVGARGFGIAYSILSTAILVWLIVAANRAPFAPIWDTAPWMPHVTLTVMFLVCLLLAASIARPNPFSFGGARNARFDPAHPGVVRLTRHPLLLALALWAFAHLLSNGDLAHVILFGAFGAFALMGGRMIDRRKRRELSARGQDHEALWAATRKGTIWPARDQRGQALARLLIGIGLYGALLSLHGLVIGVVVWP